MEQITDYFQGVRIGSGRLYCLLASKPDVHAEHLALSNYSELSYFQSYFQWCFDLSLWDCREAG